MNDAPDDPSARSRPSLGHLAQPQVAQLCRDARALRLEVTRTTAGATIVDAGIAAVGGLEHAALAGFVLGAAARRVPVVLDGVIADSAALAAAALAPDAVGAMIAGHRSAEPGAAIVGVLPDCPRVLDDSAIEVLGAFRTLAELDCFARGAGARQQRRQEQREAGGTSDPA